MPRVDIPHARTRTPDWPGPQPMLNGSRSARGLGAESSDHREKIRWHTRLSDVRGGSTVQGPPLVSRKERDGDMGRGDSLVQQPYDPISVNARQANVEHDHVWLDPLRQADRIETTRRGHHLD